MRQEKFPIWSAYLIAPILTCVFGAETIMKSESPGILWIGSAVLGLLCAGVLHAYMAIKKRIAK